MIATTLLICGALTVSILTTFVLTIIRTEEEMKSKPDIYLYTEEYDTFKCEVWSTPRGTIYYKFVKKEPTSTN